MAIAPKPLKPTYADYIHNERILLLARGIGGVGIVTMAASLIVTGLGWAQPEGSPLHHLSSGWVVGCIVLGLAMHLAAQYLLGWLR